MKPMNHKLITLTIGFLMCALVSFGQDSIPKKTEIKRLTESDFVAGETYVIDTIIDGNNFFKKGLNIKPEMDSIQNRKLLDHPHASEIDEKWLEELYSNVLFDSIYESVTTLKYDPVDYPELTTDTLKARLKRLNDT
jgi:membrane-bound lytic murein transglycosylase D